MCVGDAKPEHEGRRIRLLSLNTSESQALENPYKVFYTCCGTLGYFVKKHCYSLTSIYTARNCGCFMQLVVKIFFQPEQSIDMICHVELSQHLIRIKY